MDQTPSQNPLPGDPRVPASASSMPEYWDNNVSMYPAPDSHHAHPPPQQHQQQQPLGISWDHPIFAQQNRRQGHASHQDQNHGIYSPAPQSWQSNALDSRLISPAPPGFGLPPQYQQVRQYPEGQVPFDPHSASPPESSSFAPYSFPQNYYPSQRHSVLPETLPQATPMQSVPSQAPQLSQYQPNAHQPPLAPYSQTPIPFPAGYETGSNVPDHRTINPQFLDIPQQAPSAQNPSLQGNFLYLSPADFERQDNGKRTNLYQQGLQVPPALHHPGSGQFQHFQNILPAQQPVNIAGLQRQKPGPKAQSPQTKKAKVRTIGKKAGASPSSESDSGDDSDLEVQEPDEPSPIPPSRPSDAVAAAKYDALMAVWSPRNKSPHVDKVKNALVTFKDIVKAIRDAWKESAQAMKVAENKGENDAATKIKEDVILRRRVINAVVTTALEKGHPRIVEKLGEHPMAVSALYSFLLDRHQAADMDGELTVNILNLLARFTTVDEDVLQKTNVAKLLPRLSKKGSQTVKTLSQEILDNAASSTKRKQGHETAKSPPKEEPVSRSPTSNATSSGKDRPELAGSKRPRESESNGLPSTKRVLAAPQPKNNGTRPASAGAGAAKRPQETGQDGKGTAIASRPKANIVAPKPTNLFGSLSTASKRPGTSNAERAAAAAKAGSGSPEKKEAPPAPKPAFSFGDLMADLNRQKSPAPAEPSENRPPETEEERERRLRKERRRKLRVSWKPDATLTEVRLFTHDPEEELGPGDRSVGDVKGEGSVLKLHRDLDELEDEDEGGTIREEALRDYRALSGIDLAAVSADDHARNFIKRAGIQQPVSPEKDAQEHREATTLMVFYTSPADVPSSPKEAPPPDLDEMVPDETAFGELPDQVKARQDRYRTASRPAPAPSQPNAQNNQFDISGLLKAIQGAPQQQQQPIPPSQPATQPVSQPPMSDLERTINMFRQQQPQPQPQPQIPQFPTTQAPAAQGFDFQRLMAVVNAQQQMQQPQMSQPPAMPPSQPSQPAVSSNIAAIVSQFANQNQQSGANQAQQLYEDPGRKRMREQVDDDGSYEDQFNQTKQAKQVGLTKHPKAGLVLCRYWNEGRCVKGNECTFRHDPR